MENYKVEIWQEMLFGYAMVVSRNGRIIARTKTWTRSGARRQARHIIKQRKPRQHVQYVIHK